MCPAGRRRPVVRPPSRQSVPAGTRRSRPRERRRDALLSSSIPPPFRGRRDRQRVRYRMATDRLPSRVVLEFHVLGPLEVVGEGGALRLGGPRQRATLAILLLQGNRVVPVERLADELYAGRPPVSAVTQVQRQISDLRRALGAADAIETRPPGYVLHLGDDDFDLARFERLTAMAERARAREDVEAAAGLLREALERAILRQEPVLDPGGTPVPGPARTVLVAPSRDQKVEALVELAAVLPAQLVVARLVLHERELAGAATAVGLHRSHARTAAFTSDDLAADLVR